MIAREDVVRLEWSARPGRKGRGALIGFAVGLAAILGRTLAQGGCNDGCDASNVAEAALLASATAAVGAIVSPGERWLEVPLDRVPALTTKPLGSAPQLRLVPQVGRRFGIAMVASF